TIAGIWAGAKRQTVNVIRTDGTNMPYGPWRQVSRLGFPLINEAVIGLQDKDRWNRSQPQDDAANFASYYLNPIIVRDAEVVGQYSACGAGALASTCQLAGMDANQFKSN